MTISLGLAIIHAEAGERRAFLPSFAGRMAKLGFDVVLEKGYGEAMGFSAQDYLDAAPRARFAGEDEVYGQDIVLVLRWPGEARIEKMKPGACLVTMAHYPTRPARVAFLRARGIESLSLDSAKNDDGQRLVENLRSVAWNGVETAFQVLMRTYPSPGLESPERTPVYVTVLGVGAVGVQAVQAAIRYGDEALWKRMAQRGVPGVVVTAVDYDMTPYRAIMQDLLRRTDILVDATQRADSTAVVIPNEWIGPMPPHAVLLDLSVDPYNASVSPPEIKGIEGVPQGNLDRYIFAPDDPIYETIPPGVKTEHRRHAVSCYSWPGIHPQPCMDVYGRQIGTLMRIIMERGGVDQIDPHGTYFQRVIGRALLSSWRGG